jgi:hypothetical protein
MPVPVATQMSAASLLAGKSSTLPVGPVIMISVPFVARARKLEQIPSLAGSSLFISGHQ